jgi:hypothetical protein
MTALLTPEWIGLALEVAADAPGLDRPGLDARIRCEVTGGDDGDVVVGWILRDGRPGPDDGATGLPEVTLTVTADDAVAVVRGELDPNVAFMQGRLKVAGAMEPVLAMLARAGTPPVRELLGSLAGELDA